MESMLGKRTKTEISMKIENLFKNRNEEEKSDRLVRITGPNVNIRELPFRATDIAQAVNDLAMSIQLKQKTV